MVAFLNILFPDALLCDRFTFVLLSISLRDVQNKEGNTSWRSEYRKRGSISFMNPRRSKSKKRCQQKGRLNFMTGSDVSLLGHLHYLFTYRSMYLFNIFDGRLESFFLRWQGICQFRFLAKNSKRECRSTHSYQIELQSHEKGACVHQRPARAGLVNNSEGLSSENVTGFK